MKIDIVSKLRSGSVDSETCTKAADEIERLQGIIRNYCIAEMGYEDNPDDEDDVVLKREWLSAWSAMEKEGKSLINAQMKRSRKIDKP